MLYNCSVVFFMKNKKVKYGLILSTLLFSLCGCSNSNETHYLTIRNTDGGMIEALSDNLVEQKESYSVYSFHNGERVILDHTSFGGYDFSTLRAVKTNSNFKYRLRSYEQSENSCSFVMPNRDITVIPSFARRGYQLNIYWETKYTDINLSWHGDSGHSTIKELNQDKLYTVDTGAEVDLSLVLEPSHSFARWELTMTDSKGDLKMAYKFTNIITYVMPEADVSIRPVLNY